MSKRWIVVTTINSPTIAIEKIADLCQKDDWRAVVVGDKKTPSDWSIPGIDYLSVDSQRELYPQLAEKLPYNHYCRKNIGYSYAIERGAEVILETDDDNIPYDNFGAPEQPDVVGPMVGGDKWINIYRYFSDSNIWPRGIPLDEIYTHGQINHEQIQAKALIQQYLADGDPDVDAIYRLLYKSETVFAKDKTYLVDQNSWVPFNSQNTVFFKEAFPLLYLPCHVSFRMTDIWRSFVAQQAIWIKGGRMVFKSATVKQIRNEHDLVKDFAQEIDGYLGNKKIIAALESAAKNIGADEPMAQIARKLWASLHAINIINDDEMLILDCWFNSLNIHEN